MQRIPLLLLMPKEGVLQRRPVFGKHACQRATILSPLWSTYVELSVSKLGVGVCSKSGRGVIWGQTPMSSNFYNSIFPDTK